MTDEMVSRTTRGLFRSLMTGSTVGEIGAAFQDEGFAPDPDCTYQDSSVRRQTTQEYLDAVDWSDPRHVTRALRVLERLMHGFEAQYTEQLRHSLRRDGYVTDPATGHVVSAGPQFAADSLAGLQDASAIREQLDRIQRAIADDPALAVGSAKELIESTAKVVLAERGLPVSDKADLPELVRQAQQALGLHPHGGRPRRATKPRVRDRPRRRASTGRPPAPPRSPSRQRSLHLVPADARHTRRSRSTLYGSRHSLADQGDLCVAGESGTLVEPAGACLVPSAPVDPVVFVSGRAGDGGGFGDQVLDLRDGERDHAGIGGRRLVRRDRSGCLGVGAVAEQGGGDGADREGGHHQDGVPGDRGIQPDLGLVQPEAVLPELEPFFYGPPQAGCADQPGLGAQLPVRDVAVMEGQLTGPGVAADQQVMLRRGCADPRPRVPPVALGALACGPDLPAALVLQQRGDGFGAGQHGPAAHRDPEIRGHPQHVRLLLRLEELPQLRAVAVYLVPAREVELDAVGSRVLADIDGELALGAELKVQRQPRPQRLHRIRDVLTRYPLPEPDQRVPGLLPHIGQVNRIDSVGDPVRAAHMLALDAGSEFR